MISRTGAMNDPDDTLLAYRHTLIEQVIERFNTAWPRREVQLFLFPCVAADVGSARGFVKQGEERPTLCMDTQQGAPVSDVEKAKLSNLNPVQELRVGEHIHIAVESNFAGFLHLFNFGTDGRVAKLFPHSPESALEVPASKTVFVTPSQGCSPFVKERIAFREMGDGHANQVGKANGYPERVFALVMARKVAVEAGDLHPDWHVFDSSYRGVGESAWDQGEVIDGTRDEFSRRFRLGECAWGYLEVPVVDVHG